MFCFQKIYIPQYANGEALFWLLSLTLDSVSKFYLLTRINLNYNICEVYEVNNVQ